MTEQAEVLQEKVEIVLFKSHVTSEALAEYTKKAEGLEGLYVDMSDDDARRHIKDQAHEINHIIKGIDTARKALKSSFNAELQKECDFVTSVLLKANEPYTLLIADHTAAEKKKRQDEKDAIEKEAKYQQFLLDHIQGHDDNRLWDLEKKQAEMKAFDEARELEKAAAEKAAEIAEQAIQDEKDKVIRAENAAAQAIEDAAAEKLRLQKQAEQLAIDNENERIRAANQATLDAEKAETLRIANEKKAADLVIENKRLSDIAVENARLAEVARADAEKKAQEQIRIQNEANDAHCLAVMTSVKELLMKNCGLNQEQARLVVIAGKNKTLGKMTISFV